MRRPIPDARYTASRDLLIALLVFLAGVVAQPLAAQTTCIEGSPAYGVCGSLGAELEACRSALWGTLVPADRGQLPFERDTTRYTGNEITDARNPLFQSLDIEGNTLFSAYYNGFHVWDIGGENAGSPNELAEVDGRATGVPSWPQASEVDNYVQDIDAPGTDDFVAVSGQAPVGVLLYDTTNRGEPRLMYQDRDGKSIREIYAATIGGRAYAFAAANAGDLGIHVYDITAAREYSACHEDASEGRFQCPGVYLGPLVSNNSMAFLDGVASPGNDKHFVAVASGRPDGFGVQIWEVTDPQQPDLLVGGLGDQRAEGLALWERGGRYYFAVRRGLDVDFFDLTTCLKQGCGSFPQRIGSFRTAEFPSERFLTYSESADGTPFLYAGANIKCNEGRQHEYLLDVSDPRNPRDISPQGTYSVGGVEVDYWGWYYSLNPSGFSQVMPRRGKFKGNYFYRAALTLLDAHELASTDPIIQLNGPAEGYRGDAATFTASGSNCVPDPGGWNWTASNGGVVTGTGATRQITWSVTGVQTVTVTNSACSGAVDEASINIVEPAPQAGAVTVTPADPKVCDRVTFEAVDITGRPTLSYAWELSRDSDGLQIPLDPSTGNPINWQDLGASDGGYTVTVTASNADGTDSASMGFTLAPLGTLTFDGPGGAPVCTNCDAGGSPPAGTVQLDAVAPEGNEYNWDFGDGQGFRGWTSDEQVSHTYTETGSKTIQVKARNCQTSEIVSAELQVEILRIEPLVASFAAQGCNSNPCVFTLDEPIPFQDDSTGPPDSWAYDWTNSSSDPADCQFGTAQTQPATEHTYTTEGSYYPCLKVTRGSEEDVSVHPRFFISAPVQSDPPTIDVFGPSVGDVGSTYRFRASARNCTPSASGWSWSTQGGNIPGSSIGSEIQVSWSSSGRKRVTATNSACDRASGSASISIQNPDDGGGGGGGGSTIAADFTFSPSSPQSGEPVTFDASSSTGSPEFYTWTFPGDVNKSGRTVEHTFAEGGAFQVTLEVSKRDNSCNLGFCGDGITKTVSVAGGPVVDASFEADAQCVQDLGVNRCLVDTGQSVRFVANAAQADGYTWDFGDGTTSTGRVARHAWSAPGTYSVTLTVEVGGESGSSNRRFLVEGPEVAETVILPWIAQADPDKALQQESDLYVHNPGPGSLKVRITFYRQGLPEPDPPSVQRTLAEHATLYFADVMNELFNRPNIKGFLEIEPLEGQAQPVVTSFNRTFNEDRTYGQVIPGFPRGASAAERQGGADVLHLVGLNDNRRRLAYFGITNPTDGRLRFNLRFYDALGRQLASTSEPLGVPAFGFRQFQVETIHDQFGVRSQDDYRVAIEPVESAGTPIPFGANLRLGSRDPSFLRVGRTDAEEVFIVGALDTQGLNASLFQSDVILTNTSDELVNVDLTFTGAGFFTEPTEAIEEPLPPGGTTRLADVISEWDDVGGVGVLRLVSDSSSGVYPLVQGESYEVSNPNEIYGQFMPALTMDDAAVPGEPVSLVGLRQDADFLAGTRSTVWLYNPEDKVANYTLRYFDHSGAEIGVDEQLRLPPGKFRQINPGHHPLPEGGAPEGFVLRVDVESGALLVAGQVVNDFNDPAYLVGR